jgi:hypothetical protein
MQEQGLEGFLHCKKVKLGTYNPNYYRIVTEHNRLSFQHIATPNFTNIGVCTLVLSRAV